MEWKKQVDEFYRFRAPSAYEIKALIESLLASHRQEVLEEASKKVAPSAGIPLDWTCNERALRIRMADQILALNNAEEKS